MHLASQMERTGIQAVALHLRNVYRYFVLCLNIYLVDVLFNISDKEARWHLGLLPLLLFINHFGGL